MDGSSEKPKKLVTDEDLLDASVGPTPEWSSLSSRLEFGKEQASKFGPLRLDLATQELLASDSGRSVHLEPLEYQILWLLIRAEGEEVPLEEIEEFLYRDRPDKEQWPDSNLVVVIITRLRDILSKLDTGVFIPKLVERRGYSRYRVALGTQTGK